MKKETKQFRIMRVYIPEDFFTTQDKFEELIKIDTRLDKNDRNVVPVSGKLRSAAIRKFMKAYVKKGIEQINESQKTEIKVASLVS